MMIAPGDTHFITIKSVAETRIALHDINDLSMVAAIWTGEGNEGMYRSAMDVREVEPGVWLLAVAIGNHLMMFAANTQHVQV